MTAPLIGLLGLKRSGKDTFADRLISHHGFERVAFADPLKAAALALDPIVWGEERSDFLPEVRLSGIVGTRGWERAKEEPEVRRILQALGVAVRDHVGANSWLEAAASTIRPRRRAGTPVVVTDVRFPNEAEWISAAGGVLVRIERPGTEPDGHVSESALLDWSTDFVVPNAGRISDLQDYADAIVYDFAPRQYAASSGL